MQVGLGESHVCDAYYPPLTSKGGQGAWYYRNPVSFGFRR